MTEIPKQSGTYAIWLENSRIQKIAIGRLGEMQTQAGFFIYIGSAFGPGGLAARLGRHLNDNKKLRWHIDYLRAHTRPVRVSFAVDQKLEHKWAQTLALHPDYTIPFPGFGSSDCQCVSHLFYSTTLFPSALPDGKVIDIQPINDASK